MIYSDFERDLIVLCSSKLSYRDRMVLLDNLKTKCVDFEKNGSKLIKSRADGVYNKVYTQFFDERYRKKLFEDLEKSNINCVTYFSDEYPELLKKIPTPPIVLFCKGDTSLLKRDCFSIVGSRRTPVNIVAETKRMAGEIASKFVVVSGIADGADAAAVEGALSKGKAIVVLANGHNHIYPVSNERLQRRVESEGLVISEYPPDEEVRNYHFPIRNRIIAGLSMGLLVVSAGERSGALITAEHAVEFGRNIFAYPYSLGVESGAGCNELIKKGAFLTCDTLDIFTVFGLNFKRQEQDALSEMESQILKVIAETGSEFAPKIAEKLGKMPHELIAHLSALEIKGRIVRLGGNRYSIINR